MPATQPIIRFPEINLRTRDAHKLRGYFGNLFKEKSELPDYIGLVKQVSRGFGTTRNVS